MGSGGRAEQVARWTALSALFLIPLAPLLVADTYFFPFITGKAFYFRILVEVAVAAWVVLALLNRDYRPRFSWIGAAAAAFVLWMFVADAFALNAAKAFWSNFERMEGWVLLIHLLGFFLAAGAVLRVAGKWRAWFLSSLGVSVVISGHALLQLAGTLAIHQGSSRIDASFGNSSYLAIYLLFNVFIALWLALTESRAWLKWSLTALAVLEGVLVFYTGTRGAILGLIGALTLAALLTLLTAGPVRDKDSKSPGLSPAGVSNGAGKRARSWAAGALLLLLVLAGSFYLARDSAFVRDNFVLGRIASISLADGATRFAIWGMAFEGVAERPLTGWGQEGFNYVFNKYYNPSLYGQEQWFDRAHNVFLDWLTAGGVPAFLLYLSLFGTMVVLLWRSSTLSRPERVLLTAALAGYAVHNIFVFDNLYSYIYFFALLALVDSQVARPIRRLEEAPVLSDNEGVSYALPISAAIAFALIWTVNVPGMRVASGLITALSPAEGGLAENIAAFEKVAARPAFAAQEVREQLVSFASTVAQSAQATDEQKRQVIALAVSEMQKHVDAYPLDARARLQLAYAYRAAGDAAAALREIREAARLSPEKEQILVQEGAAAWDSGDLQAAQKAFNAAYALGPQFADLAAYAAAGNIVVGESKLADDILREAYGTTNVDSDILAVAYYHVKNWPRLISLWKLRTEAPGASAETWFSLAAAYYTSGDAAQAIATINQAVELFPEAATSGASAIKQIQGR